MWKVVAEFRAGYICMHAQGAPQTMQANPAYADVVREVGDFFRERLQRLEACEVAARTGRAGSGHRVWQNPGT